MIFLWIILIMIAAAIVLPVLKMLGVINWDWKYVLITIWTPLLVMITWFLWFFIPIFVFGLILFGITGGKPI